MSTQPLLVPQFLRKGKRSARSECRKVVRQLLKKDVQWNDVYELWQFEDCLQTEFSFILNDEFQSREFYGAEAYHIYLVGEAMAEELAKLHGQHERRAEALGIARLGLGHFWYALASMAVGQRVILCGQDDGLLPQLMKPYAEAMCSWSGAFLALEDRFVNGQLAWMNWPYWFRGCNFFHPFSTFDEMDRLLKLPRDEGYRAMCALLNRRQEVE
jgi:hypothetical protein